MTGLVLVYAGYQIYASITSQNLSKPNGIIMLGGRGVSVDALSISVTDDLSDRESGWMTSIWNFTSSDQTMLLVIRIQNETRGFSYVCQTDFDWFEASSSYEARPDRTQITIKYRSRLPKNRFWLMFEWRVYQKVSYDTWRIPILFYNPFFGRSLFKELQNISLGNSSIPKIERLAIDVACKDSHDSSLSYPTSTSFYQTEEYTKIFWVFDAFDEKSSVYCVFRKPGLADSKAALSFISGVLVSAGISISIQGLLRPNKERAITATKPKD